VPVVSAACAESGASALACASEASAAGDFDVKILERPFEVLHPASHSAAAAIQRDAHAGFQKALQIRGSCPREQRLGNHQD